MDNTKLLFKVFHHDDCCLSLELPKNLIDKSQLSQEDIRNEFNIFARILFDNVLNKDRKEFQIIFNEETNTWEYMIPELKDS
jgi:hypothetical protein